MNLLSVLELLGGIGCFLFGMNLMGTYLKQLAGSSLEQILERLTTGKRKWLGYLKGWSLGAGMTAIIQSSAATTIMLIGFVNAGIMKLVQAIPVMMGANVGSTVTSQILRLGDLRSDSLALQLLKPSSFAPILVGVGAFIHLFAKRKRAKDLSGILAGLGLLFYGMTMMEEVFAPLRESERFHRLFTSFENPALGILIGLIVTAIIQSSSASVGILQALSATGQVTYANAIPILLGQNIGKCATILLGSIGAGKKAKRVSVSYLLFNLFGAALYSAVLYTIYYTAGIPWFADTVNRGNIANLHLLFNLLSSVLLLPFTERIAALTGRIVGRDVQDAEELEFSKLDDLLLSTPTVALNQSRNLVRQMCRRIQENFILATSMTRKYEEDRFPVLEENEHFIDRCETVLSSYIIKIDRKRLSPEQIRIVKELLNSVSDLERIGDYSINIGYIAKDMHEASTSFTSAGTRELEIISSAAAYALETLWNAFETSDRILASRMEPLSEVIDELKDRIKANHIERLESGLCTVQGGVDLYDLLTCFERISAHAANIALHIIARCKAEERFDEMHGHAVDLGSEEYRALRQYYEAQYIRPVSALAERIQESEITS